MLTSEAPPAVTLELAGVGQRLGMVEGEKKLWEIIVTTQTGSTLI